MVWALVCTAGYHLLFQDISHGYGSGARVSGKHGRTNGDVVNHPVNSIQTSSERVT